MSIAALLNLPCVITRRTAGVTVNEYGDPIDDETTIATVCELQQQNRDENDDRGQVATSTWLLILPADTDILLGDAVTIDGTRYEVIGEPWRARNPRTQVASHIEARLQRSASTGDPQGS